MTMKNCCICGREYEKPNFYRHLKSKKDQLKLGVHLKGRNKKYIFPAEEKCFNTLKLIKKGNRILVKI